MEAKSNILVPIDFTAVTEKALEHACVLAQQTHEHIHLLHVVKKAEDTQNIELKQQLNSIRDKHHEKYGVPIISNIREGNIFNTISEFSQAEKSRLIVMGTHGVRGVQYIVGAFAVRVIMSSKIPVIITQLHSQIPSSFDRILIPINDSEEIKQKLLKAIEFAKLTNAEVHLFKKHSENEVEVDKITLNTNFYLKHLQQQGVSVNVVEMRKGSNDFSKEFTDYAKKIAAKLIVILTTPEKGIKEFVLGPVEQQVINNHANIPVMCINTLQTIYS